MGRWPEQDLPHCCTRRGARGCLLADQIKQLIAYQVRALHAKLLEADFAQARNDAKDSLQKNMKEIRKNTSFLNKHQVSKVKKAITNKARGRAEETPDSDL